MNYISKAIVFGAMLLTNVGARADERLCQDIESRLHSLEENGLFPASQQMRGIVSAGLSPVSVQHLFAVAYQYSPGYVTARSLRQALQDNRCTIAPTVYSPACLQALSLAPAVGSQFKWVNDNFAQLILTGNLPKALGWLGELFRTENDYRQVKMAIRTQCAPRVY